MNYSRKPRYVEPIFSLHLTQLEPKNIDRIAHTCRILANSNRLFILAVLEVRDTITFCQIQDSTELSPSLISQYLNQLIAEGLVLRWQTKSTTMYQLAKPRLQIQPSAYPGHGHDAIHVYPYT